ncbi:MAG: hypothetical protein QF719_02195 [Chloroflexota bacterium]|nr:hypothetical protein [Chloroflexota bacterium]MDP6757015.1 hypothetical protein [Chloroflexota bacterium]
MHAVGSGGELNEFEADTYLVNIHLPNNVVLVGVRVSEGTVAGCDVLLGMDVIALGDFAITNQNGHTWWTFRIPPDYRIDFVEESKESKAKSAPDRRPLNRQQRRQREREERKKNRG